MVIVSVWQDFVTASLLGTEKGAATPVLPAALTDTLGPTDDMGREVQFLTHAGALAWWRRTGWKPLTGDTTLPPPAEDETGPLINPASVAHLRIMLAGRNPSMLPEWFNQSILPEWLREAARLRRRLPPEALPAMLEQARKVDLRSAVLAAGGARIHWLAQQNPAWAFATNQEAPDQWETGHRDVRLVILRAWRAADPALAREKLASVWKAEAADVRAAFLGALSENLSDADSPFLDAALDDRSKEVRAIAVDLLSRLPGSPFVARMITRVAPLLGFKPSGLLKRAAVQVTLPGELDEAARRDGLNPKDLVSSQGMGEKATLLMHILAAVPLQHWTDLFQQTPGTLLDAANRNDFAESIIGGWTLATVRQRDPAWAAALLDGLRPRKHTHFVRHEQLFDLLPVAEREQRLLSAMRAEPLKANTTDVEIWIHSLGQLGFTLTYLSEALARVALAQLRAVMAVEANGLRTYRLQNVAGILALRTPPALLTEAAEGWPADKEGVPALLNSFTFRRDALAALTQP